MKFRAAWLVQGAGRVLGDAGEVHSARINFDEEEQVVATQHNGVDGEEVARDNPGCLSTEERLPGLRCSVRRGVDAGGLEDRPHRRRSNRDAEPGEFSVDAAVTPR